jgi:glycosyltransferase involved in cell wall biosynthesis
VGFLVVLPAIDRELTERCVESMGPLASEVLVLVDNSRDGFAAGWDAAEVLRPEVNLGVARSWNLGARRVLDRGLDYLVLLSAATTFGPGGFDRFAEVLDSAIDCRGVQTQEGWHCLALGRELLEVCGAFDENFWPAYLDDIDYLRRMEVSGLWHPGHMPLPQVLLDAERWGDAHGMTKAGVRVNFGALVAYYGQKWGGPAHEERWTSPFFDRPLGYWPEATVEQLAVRYCLDDPARR